MKDHFIKIGLQKPAGLSGTTSFGAHGKGGVTYTPQICNLGSLNSLSTKGWGNTWENFACRDGFQQEGKCHGQHTHPRGCGGFCEFE